MLWNYDRMSQILLSKGAKRGKELKYTRVFELPNDKIVVAKNPGGKAVVYVNDVSATGEKVSLLDGLNDYGMIQDFYPKGGDKKPRGSAHRALDGAKDIYCLRFEQEEQFVNFLSWYTGKSSLFDKGQESSNEDSRTAVSLELGESGMPSEKIAEYDVFEGSLVSEFGEPPNDDLSQLSLFARKVRRGQPHFRDALLELYGCKCAISGQDPGVVLEAAHIWEHALSGVNHLSNGLLLRADIHILFDEGLIKIHPESLRIEVSPHLAETEYATFDGNILRSRVDGSIPNIDYLAKRYS